MRSAESPPSGRDDTPRLAGNPGAGGTLRIAKVSMPCIGAMYHFGSILKYRNTVSRGQVEPLGRELNRGIIGVRAPLAGASPNSARAP